MTKLFWNVLKLSPVLLGATLLLANRTQAAEPPVADLAPSSSAQPSQNTQALDGLAQVTSVSQMSTQATEPLAQVTSVSQLSDVQPTDWAFLALQSLVERYGCIAGYPDSTYRGNRALTRYEFAAGLNACLDRVNELIAAATSELVTREDLATLQRLQEEFSAELATLRGRVDSLEAQTAELETNQFSTTTKLNGEVIVAVSDAFGDDRAVSSNPTTIGGPTPVAGSLGDLDVNTTLSDRVRLNFDTSFFGTDTLKTRFVAANTTPFGRTLTPGAAGDTGTNMTRLGFDENTENNDIIIERLWYRFALGPNASVKLAAVDTFFEDNLFTFNPQLAPSGTGSISRFGRFNPIYRLGVNNADATRVGGAGLTFNYNFSKALGVSLGYLAPSTSASNPNSGFALFNGSYASIGQLSFRPSDVFSLGLTYAHSYNAPANGIVISGVTGSVFANQPFGNVATSSDQYGVEASFRLTPAVTISGWGGLTYATAEDGPGAVNRGDSATMFNWAATLALQDFVKEGSVLGLVFGQPPKVTSNSFGIGSERTDADTSYHVEGFYRYRLTDNIDITPGVIVILNPEHNSDNDDIYVGTIRTTFTF